MDEDDALIMYYLHSLDGLDNRRLLRVRESLLRGLVPSGERNDAKYMESLLRARQMRR